MRNLSPHSKFDEVQLESDRKTSPPTFFPEHPEFRWTQHRHVNLGQRACEGVRGKVLVDTW